MKPMGTIPAWFSADSQGRLAIGGDDVEALITRAGDTPLFVYDMALVRSRIASLRAAMPEALGIHYAIKANPLPGLVSEIAPLVDGLDVASEGEMRIALETGAAHISFAGPGKRDREIEAAITSGVTINLESEGEARRALDAAQRIGIRPRLAIRVNPDFDLKGSGMRMGGGAKPFGIDAVRAGAVVQGLIDAGADWRGFHIFAGSQALDAQAVADTQAQTVALAGRLADEVGVSPPLVNLGGGFGIPYFPGDAQLDIALVGKSLEDGLHNRAQILQPTRFVVELGRYLVGEAGVYLSRIVDRKTSHGETFLVVDGGLHHQLAASGNFGTVVRRNYPLAVASRFAALPEEVVSVVGCLCTPLDRLGDQVSLPHADVGDIIAVFMAGAYGATASPAGFLGHPPARELVVDGALRATLLT
jgi:diaminopimelate decarboxylase